MGAQFDAAADPDVGSLEGWSTAQLKLLLDSMQAPEVKAQLSSGFLEFLDSKHGLSRRRNSEIRFRWQVICLRGGVRAIIPHVVTFLKEQGRMKFVRPLFRELMAAE